MKKIYLIARAKDTSALLGSLREAGVVHLEHFYKPSGERLENLRLQRERFEKVVERLSQKKPLTQKAEGESWVDKAEQIYAQMEHIQDLEKQQGQRSFAISQWEPWGDFDPADFLRLKEHGVYAALAQIPQKEFRKIRPEGFILELLEIRNDQARCLVICREEREFPFKTVPLPKERLSILKKQQHDDCRRIEELEKEIEIDTEYLTVIRSGLIRLDDEIAFQEAYSGRDEAESLALIKGFCPIDACNALQNLAREKGWALSVRDPDKDDNIPTLLRHSKWVKLIEPIFNLMNVLPGYHEIDVSPVFLVFFSLFFGILIGDAGYGILFMALTAFFQRKMKAKTKDQTPFALMYLLSGITIIWGILTATFFGQQWLTSTPFQAVVPWLNDMKNFQALCFFVGAFQLSIGHAWKALNKWPSWSVLGDMGWIVILWGMFFMAKFLVLGSPLPLFAKPFFAVGIFLILFFAAPQKNPLKALGAGVGELLGNLVNSFTDVVSYIRLFAVGLATVAVADAFNALALNIGFGNFFTGLLTALILVVGHVFNMILGALSILVHGLRLNVLEFSNHVNLQWAGVKYQPFKKVSDEIV